MNILKISLIIGLVVLGAGAAWSQGVVVSESVAAIDNIPPAPVTGLQALDASDASGESVVVTWALSADDARSFTAFGDQVVPQGGVRGYRIYRSADNDEPNPIATLGPGSAQYVDPDVETGTAYIYEVRPFDQDNETELELVPGSEADLARIVVIGGSPDVVIVTTVKGRMTLDKVLDLENSQAVDAFAAQFASEVAEQLDIEATRVKVTDISAGSIIVEFEIAQTEEADQLSASDAMAQLVVLVDEDPLALGDLGPVTGLVDESTTDIVHLIHPLDADGNVVLGWFTREGDKVDFDDFFLFADHFGLSAGEGEFDALFDISPNDTVDFDDFFLFADDFGKVVANADEVRTQLGL